MPTLLLADESVTTQRVIALTFADQAFQVVTVGDGQQAIDQMRAMRPDIVLASTSLPRNSGYELCQYMLGVEALKNVPVLLLSGAFESVDGTRFKASAARGVIEKPLEPTAVINRVRELLGLKAATPTAPAGRWITSATTTADRKASPDAQPPTGLKAPAAPLEEGYRAPDLDPGAPPAAAGAPGHRRDDRDSLDRPVGRQPLAPAVHPISTRTPSQTSDAPDTRVPESPPAPTSDAGTPKAGFEAADDWFAAAHQKHDRSSSHDSLADAKAAVPPFGAVAADAPAFGVDDQWLAEEETVRRSRAAQERSLAAEMGVRDIELPHAEPVPIPAAPAKGLDFDFGLDDLLKPPAPVAPLPVPPALTPEHQVPAPEHETPEQMAHEQMATQHMAPQHVIPPAPAGQAPSASGSIADDFAMLLALETGEAPPPAAATPPVVLEVAPEITEAMLDQIAQRVAERLSAGTFGADLREAIAATMRDNVRSVVSETSERLVREEIARLKARAERNTR